MATTATNAFISFLISNGSGASRIRLSMKPAATKMLKRVTINPMSSMMDGRHPTHHRLSCESSWKMTNEIGHSAKAVNSSTE